jgi:hypothetical protein
LLGIGGPANSRRLSRSPKRGGLVALAAVLESDEVQQADDDGDQRTLSVEGAVSFARERRGVLVQLRGSRPRPPAQVNSSASGADAVPVGYERHPAARTARCLIYGFEQIAGSGKARS